MRQRLSVWVAAISAAAMLGVASPAFADWRRAESDHFIVYSQGHEGQLRDYVRRLEAFDDVLRLRFGLTQDTSFRRKLPIYLVQGPRELRQISVSAGRDTQGLYIPSTEDIFAIAIRADGQSVLLHEYAHHFFFQNFAGTVPSWLTEGLAEYFMTADISSDSIVIGQYDDNRAYWLVNGTWLPLEELLSKRPSELTRRSQLETYYPLAWLLTHWFMSDDARRAQLQAYLNGINDGGDPVETMQSVTGLTLEALRADLRRYMRDRLVGMRFQGEFLQDPVEITRLPASADDLLLLNQRLKIGVPDDQRAATAAEVRRAALRHGDDPLALLALGHAELHFGDAAEGERVLTRLLELEPNHVEALQLMASSRLGQASDRPEDADALLAQARAFLARAYAADDANYHTFYLLGRTRETAAGYPNDNDLATWDLALQLAPQLPSVRLGAAQALMLADRPDDAVSVLQPLINDPHNEGLAASASALAELAAAQGAPPDLERLEALADDGSTRSGPTQTEADDTEQGPEQPST